MQVTFQYWLFQGEIGFDKVGDRISKLRVYQIRKGVLTEVGIYDPFINELVWLDDVASLFEGKCKLCNRLCYKYNSIPYRSFFIHDAY